MILRMLAVFFLAPLLAGAILSAAGQIPLPAPTENPLQERCTLSVADDCGVLELPRPTAPRVTELRDAECKVRIRVNEDGTATAKQISCTDERYIQSTIEGFTAMRLKTRDVCGQVCKTVGTEIEYPISYRVSN
jgi:hypothetical protein